MHGGASTGARTPEGLERCRVAAWKYGKRSAEARLAAAQRGEARKLTIVLLDLLKQIEPVS